MSSQMSVLGQFKTISLKWSVMGKGRFVKTYIFFLFPWKGTVVCFCLYVFFVFFFHNIFQVQQGLVPEKHAALKHFREHGIYMPPWSYSKEWSQAARLVLQACAF